MEQDLYHDNTGQYSRHRKRDGTGRGTGQIRAERKRKQKSEGALSVKSFSARMPPAGTA
jgi:hypothetical protein